MSRTTKDEASVNNACGKFWTMISGLSLEDAITHDTDEWIGDGGMIVVEDSPSGEGVRVAQFIRDPKQARAVGDSTF